MNKTAPGLKFEGIIAVAGLVAVIATGVAIVLYDFGVIGGIFVGGIVGVIAAIALALGWREPAGGPKAATASAPAPEAAPVPAPAAKEPPVPASAPKPAAVTAPAAEAPKDAPASTAAAGKPAFLSAARDGGPDDLKQIKGVGPKLEKTLHGMGIFHFDQIAAWGPDEAAWIDDNLEGFKGRATRDDWVAQAKVLATGGTTEFSGKVKKGGVY